MLVVLGGTHGLNDCDWQYGFEKSLQKWAHVYQVTSNPASEFYI